MFNSKEHVLLTNKLDVSTKKRYFETLENEVLSVLKGIGYTTSEINNIEYFDFKDENIKSSQNLQSYDLFADIKCLANNQSNISISFKKSSSSENNWFYIVNSRMP